jgi:hypothetical protein
MKSKMKDIKVYFLERKRRGSENSQKKIWVLKLFG